MASKPSADQQNDAPRNNEPPSDDGEPSEANEASETNEQSDSEGLGSQATKLARVAAQAQRVPRRTGVFVDPDDLRSHVAELLRAILGGYEVDTFGNFTFTHEGARAFVTVGPGPVGPQVGVFSVTNLDIELSQELATFLLTTNHSLGFGSFSYDPGNRAVWLRHTLLGTTLDLPELHTAVAAVASTAAHLDQRIRDRFGGRTFNESSEEMQQRMEPPDPAANPFPSAGGYL